MKSTYQVIVVGGGSSGLMAAINAAEQGAKVLLIEKNVKLGRKLLLSGGGRCNVTNRTTREELISHIPGNGKFLYSALNQFDQEDIVKFFESRGVSLKEEDHGRMFPVTNKASTILEVLVDELTALNVSVMTNTEVDKILFNHTKCVTIGVRTKLGEEFHAPSIILAVGGRAYPKTGSTGDGYAWAKSARHTIERLYPTEAPLFSNDTWIESKVLQGLSLQNVRVTVWDNDGKTIAEHQMDMIFTHFGYSGPAILRCSGHVNQWLHETKSEYCRLSIDLQPQQSIESLTSFAENYRDKNVITLLKNWVPERFANLLCEQHEISPRQAYKQLTHSQQKALLQNIKHFEISAYGSQPIEKGFVTGGGVSTKEVNPKTMESKKMKGLYFCGELLDINGYTGGYNITAAFVTGTIAGRNAAWNSFSGVVE